MPNIKQLIKYVDNLEKANKMIDKLSIPKEISNSYGKEIKDISSQLSSIIDLIDTEFYEEFYGEEE